jgi:hypothetical protein
LGHRDRGRAAPRSRGASAGPSGGCEPARGDSTVGDNAAGWDRQLHGGPLRASTVSAGCGPGSLWDRQGKGVIGVMRAGVHGNQVFSRPQARVSCPFLHPTFTRVALLLHPSWLTVWVRVPGSRIRCRCSSADADPAPCRQSSHRPRGPGSRRSLHRALLEGTRVGGHVVGRRGRGLEQPRRLSR